MPQEKSAARKQQDQYLQDMQLTQELDTPRYKAFWLHKEGTRCGSSRLLFTPEGIVILGDMAPGQYGVMSHRYQSLEWFTGELYADYLSSKFLRRGFHRGLAVEELQQIVTAKQYSFEEKLSEESCEDLTRLIRLLDCEEVGKEGLRDTLFEIDFDYFSEVFPGWGYNPNEVALLCAIQERFTHLYHNDLRTPDEP